MRFLQAIALAGLAMTSSCASLDFIEIPAAKDWNLRQLHKEDGSHRIQAATLSDTGYFLRFSLGGLLRNSRERIQTTSTSRQKHVPDQVLENFTALSKFSPKDPHIAAMQAKWSIWLAVADPWPLARERAVLKLGQISNQLELNVTPRLPAPDSVSGQEETEVALSQLIRAAKSSVFEVRVPDETEVLDIEAACDLVRELQLSVETGYKAMEVLELLLYTGDVGPEFRDPIRKLAYELTRELAGQALARAIRDPEPVVRSAAYQAIVQSTGTQVLGTVIEQMAREPSPVVLTRVLRLIRQYGLPKLPSDLSDEAATRVREVWVDVLYSFATAHHEGAVRTNAMRTLQAVVGGPGSLRSEDWQQWWYERQSASRR